MVHQVAFDDTQADLEDAQIAAVTAIDQMALARSDRLRAASDESHGEQGHQQRQARQTLEVPQTPRGARVDGTSGDVTGNFTQVHGFARKHPGYHPRTGTQTRHPFHKPQLPQGIHYDIIEALDRHRHSQDTISVLLSLDFSSFGKRLLRDYWQPRRKNEGLWPIAPWFT
jgi:hypothetical protein